jgi:hypothetical protein
MYQIKNLNLTLFEDESFLSPLFTFQYSSYNQTWDVKHCFYRGYVNDDYYSSFVSISLCNGLVSSREIK